MVDNGSEVCVERTPQIQLKPCFLSGVRKWRGILVGIRSCFRHFTHNCTLSLVGIIKMEEYIIMEWTVLT